MHAAEAIKTSQFLSWVLRHEPQAIGLSLDTEGWADVSQLVTCAHQHGQALSVEAIEHVVTTSDKKRFTLSADKSKIRAAQGHSTTQVQIQYPEQTPPDRLFHGTAIRFLDSIFQTGLTPQQRQHVHLSNDHATATAVGQRHGKAVVLTIDAKAMHAQGHSFYQAENGVWLTAAVAAKYLLA